MSRSSPTLDILPSARAKTPKAIICTRNKAMLTLESKNAATVKPSRFFAFPFHYLLCSKSRHIFFFSCYIVGITRDKSFGKLAPVGGYLLMAGWLTFAF